VPRIVLAREDAGRSKVFARLEPKICLTRGRQSGEAGINIVARGRRTSNPLSRSDSGDSVSVRAHRWAGPSGVDRRP
jgi:hypothetical protein